jgi:hypothetical protein
MLVSVIPFLIGLVLLISNFDIFLLMAIILLLAI